MLAASGNVDHDALVIEAEKAFAGLSPDSTSARNLVAAEPSAFTGSMVAVRDPDSKTTSVALAFQGLPWNDPDSVTLQVRPPCVCFGFNFQGQPACMHLWVPGCMHVCSRRDSL